jgi:hypothetical protein
VKKSGEPRSTDSANTRATPHPRRNRSPRARFFGGESPSQFAVIRQIARVVSDRASHEPRAHEVVPSGGAEERDLGAEILGRWKTAAKFNLRVRDFSAKLRVLSP